MVELQGGDSPAKKGSAPFVGITSFGSPCGGSSPDSPSTGEMKAIHMAEQRFFGFEGSSMTWDNFSHLTAKAEEPLCAKQKKGQKGKSNEAHPYTLWKKSTRLLTNVTSNPKTKPSTKNSSKSKRVDTSKCDDRDLQCDVKRSTQQSGFHDKEVKSNSLDSLGDLLTTTAGSLTKWLGIKQKGSKQKSKQSAMFPSPEMTLIGGRSPRSNSSSDEGFSLRPSPRQLVPLDTLSMDRLQGSFDSDSSESPNGLGIALCSSFDEMLLSHDPSYHELTASESSMFPRANPSLEDLQRYAEEAPVEVQDEFHEVLSSSRVKFTESYNEDTESGLGV